MAMVRPDAWIIRLELDHEISIPALHVCIPSGGIPGIDDGLAVPGTETFCQNLLHVVSLPVTMKKQKKRERENLQKAKKERERELTKVWP